MLTSACTPAPAYSTETDAAAPGAPMTSTFALPTEASDSEAAVDQAYECGDVPGDPVALSVGRGTVCARRGCALQCWGHDYDRQLGHARGEGNCGGCEAPAQAGCCLGDGEHPVDWGDVDVGAPIADVSTSGRHTCVVLHSGRVRCWGSNNFGQLGLGHTVATPLGSPPSARPDVKLGAPAVAVAAGAAHTCALLVGGGVRCWGLGEGGQLGRGDTLSVGDDELPSALGDLDLGGPAVAIAVRGAHSCAVLGDGGLRCWGDNQLGQLGYGHTETIGDDETPASAGDVPLGAAAAQVAVGHNRTCVVTTTGGVRCWGAGPTGYPGDPVCCVGDDETPDTRGDLDLGGPAIQVSVGYNVNCAVLTTGAPVCWGESLNAGRSHGLLGLVHQDCDACKSASRCCIGDDEPPSAGPPLVLGASVLSIAVHERHACAVLDGGSVRCWGANSDGLLGLGNSPEACVACGARTCCLGDDEAIAGVAPVRAFSPIL